MSAKKNYKQIAFDLDTKELEQYYPTDNWRNAYKDIKVFMKKNNFDWQQGSVYISKEKLTSVDITLLLESLIRQNPWLNKCMRDCRETNIGQTHNRNSLFNENIDIPTREELKSQEKQSVKPKPKMSLNDKIAYNQARANASNKEHKAPERQDKNKGR